MYIEISNLSNSSFSNLVEKYPKDQIFVLVDENTKSLFSHLLNCTLYLSEAEIIEIESGEENKTLETVVSIWQYFSENQVRRNALLINLGGGVITDMGGFIASTYKRGIDFINIPTSLLAMIDAAIGGKTGIDLDNFKNQIGTFQNAHAVFCDAAFLQTLPKNQIYSGFAEALKHGLIKDQAYWKYCINREYENLDWDYIISGSIRIKETIVLNDPKENGERKLLNFGHTIGHAIETINLRSNSPILHGHAVAIGMICEAHISFQKGFLEFVELNEITTNIKALYAQIQIENDIFQDLIELMKNDKKNISAEINFSLLKGIGHGIHDQSATEIEIKNSLAYYMKS